MSKQAILTLYVDAQGTSFLLFDPKDRVAYEDVIEGTNVSSLYERFVIRLTVTNTDYIAPHGKTVRFDRDVASDNEVHYSCRARRYARDFLSARADGGSFTLKSLSTLPLEFESEEWHSWMGPHSLDSCSSVPSSSPELSVSLAE